MKVIESNVELINVVRRMCYMPPACATPELVKALADAADAHADIVTICDTAEALYAYRECLDKATLEVAAGIVGYCAMNGWHSIRGDRGAQMVWALRREAGEDSPTGSWPKPEADPAPDSRYTKQPEPAPMLAPVAP